MNGTKAVATTKWTSWLCPLALVAALAGAEAARAGTIAGSGEIQITGQTPVATGIQLTGTASGAATRLGAFTRVEELILDPVSNRFTGTVTFTGANGDQLTAAVWGAFVGPTTATGTYEWTFGTGKFEHPVGSARFVATTSDGAHFAVQFNGELSVVKAPS